jgi:hypothetical protein
MAARHSGALCSRFGSLVMKVAASWSETSFPPPVIASLTKRFGRAVGEKIVADLIARAEAINARDDLLYLVWELALFGSMLDPRAQALGDVDVVYDVRPKDGGNGWSEKNIARANLMEFGHLSYSEKIRFGKTEVDRLLKNRNGRLSMQEKWSFDELEPKPESKTIYTAPADVRARAFVRSREK